MVTIKRFEQLEVWQTSRKLTRRIYEVSRGGRLCQDFGLRDQLRRASVSVMSNIAEGFESRTTPMFTEYLGRAKGSAGEIRAQLYASLDAGYVRADEFSELMDLATATSRQISGLMKYLTQNRAAYPVRAVPPPSPSSNDETSNTPKPGVASRSDR